MHVCECYLLLDISHKFLLLRPWKVFQSFWVHFYNFLTFKYGFLTFEILQIFLQADSCNSQFWYLFTNIEYTNENIGSLITQPWWYHNMTKLKKIKASFPKECCQFRLIYHSDKSINVVVKNCYNVWRMSKFVQLPWC